MGQVLLRHCFKKGVVPIIMTHWPSGVGLARELIDGAAKEATEKWGKEFVSGRDYVFLGFRPGYTDLVLGMGENIRSAFARDYYGQPTEGMAAMEGVRSEELLSHTTISPANGQTAMASCSLWIVSGRSAASLYAGTTIE